MDKLEFSFKTNGLGAGKANINSAFIRPFKVVAENRNIGSLSFQYYKEGSNDARVFGTFAYLKSGRLLFFPGISGQALLWDTDSNVINAKGYIDHITLEKDFKQWHITTELAGQKEPSGSWYKTLKTKEVTPNFYHWFGFSIKNSSLLEKAPSEITLSHTGNPRDLEKKSNKQSEALVGAIHNVLMLNADESIDYKNGFLHFDVFVDNRWFAPLLYKLKRYKLFTSSPTSTPILEANVNAGKLSIRIHRVKIGKLKGCILVSVASCKGLLRENYVLSCFKN